MTPSTVASDEQSPEVSDDSSIKGKNANNFRLNDESPVKNFDSSYLDNLDK